jgi:hypothetical protein
LPVAKLLGQNQLFFTLHSWSKISLFVASYFFLKPSQKNGIKTNQNITTETIFDKEEMAPNKTTGDQKERNTFFFLEAFSSLEAG